MKARPALTLCCAAVVAASCLSKDKGEKGKSAPPPPPPPILLTDTNEYAVQLQDGLHRTTIRYAYTNTQPRAVSSTQCQEPPPPVLEKATVTGWIVAYQPVLLMCETIPPFRISPGATHRGTLHVAFSAPSRNMDPSLLVDSIPGIYRLRWVLRGGPDPRDTTVAMVEAASGTFRFVER
jgi:hypothetical protein